MFINLSPLTSDVINLTQFVYDLVYSVGMRPRTDRRTIVTTIHFASSTTHAKCKEGSLEAHTSVT